MGIHALPLVLILSSCLRPLQDHLHGLVVVSLDLEVRYPAVALGCGNLAMAQWVQANQIGDSSSLDNQEALLVI